MINKYRIYDKEYAEYCEEPDWRWMLSREGKLYNSENDEWHTVGERFLVGFFTGEKDKNDVEIYQDDFLESELGNIFLVDFRKGSWVIVHEPTCGTELHGECKTDYLFDSIDFYKLKVIGNIHENKELL